MEARYAFSDFQNFSRPQVLTISGVARVFVTKRVLLTALGDFQKAWRLLLENIEKLSLSTTQEVSLAALKSFHEMVLSGSGSFFFLLGFVQSLTYLAVLWIRTCFLLVLFHID